MSYPRNVQVNLPGEGRCPFTAALGVPRERVTMAEEGGTMRFGRLRASALAVGLAGMFSLMMVLPGLAASSTVTVTPASLSFTSWYFYDDTNDIPSTTEDPL